MKEQSHIDDMRAAVRGDRERAEKKRQVERAPAPPIEPEPAPGQGEARAPGLWGRLFRRR